MYEIQEPWQVFLDRELLECMREQRYQERDEPERDHDEMMFWEQEDAE